MATKTTGRRIYLGLDYSEFTGGAAEINRKMGLLDAGFALASQQVKNYGSEMDATGVKHDYLSQKIALQKQLVDAAKKAYDDASSSQNQSQRVIDALEKKLLQERTSLEKLEGQLKKTDEKQEELNDTTESFGDAIRSMASTIGLDVSPGLENLASKFDKVDKNVGVAVVTIGAMIGGLISCTTQAAATADELLTLSAQTHLTTDAIQKLQYASEFIDVSFETVSGSITKLTRNMNDARDGAGTAGDAFNELRIKITDSSGQLRDANEVFYDAIDALGNVRNETERDAYAMEMFGRSAKDLNPLIEAGSERLRELGIEAENLGTVMAEDDLEALGALNDSFDKFEQTTDALKNSLAMALLPVLSTLFEAISNIPVPVLQTLVTLVGVTAAIVSVVNAVSSLSKAGNGIKTFFSGFNLQTLKTTMIVMGIVAALIALATVIAVIAGKSNDVKNAMESTASMVTDVQNTVSGAQEGAARVSSNAAGTKNFVGGETWVGEDGPELVSLPRGSRIYNNEESRSVASGDTYYVNVTIPADNIKEFNDVIDIMQRQRAARIRGAVKV